jgi:hypothetical protein
MQLIIYLEKKGDIFLKQLDSNGVSLKVNKEKNWQIKTEQVTNRKLRKQIMERN